MTGATRRPAHQTPYPATNEAGGDRVSAGRQPHHVAVRTIIRASLRGSDRLALVVCDSFACGRRWGISDRLVRLGARSGDQQPVGARWWRDCLRQIGSTESAAAVAAARPALEFAFEATGRGGTTVTSGLPSSDVRLSIGPTRMVAEQRTLKGSYLSGHVPPLDVTDYIALFQSGRLPVDRLLTHRLKLDEINEGFERLADGKAIRQVIEFD